MLRIDYCVFENEIPYQMANTRLTYKGFLITTFFWSRVEQLYKSER